MKGTEPGSGSKNRREGISSLVLVVKAYRCPPKHTDTHSHGDALVLVLTWRPHCGEVLRRGAQEKVSGSGEADG